MYKHWIFPLLARLDPEMVHDRTLQALALAQRILPGLLHRLAGPLPEQPVSLFGLRFPNPLGLAAGFDKEVRVAAGLAALGFGHIEVGTLTPRPQSGNPRPRIFRLRADAALINRMGFPNKGVGAALPHLRRLAQQPHDFVVGVSLGKQKETPLDGAAADYITVMEQVFPYADYLAVNISSPNTPGLRELQGGRYLTHLLRSLGEANDRLATEHSRSRRPLLVKIAPDLTAAELDEILEIISEQQVDGIIATNTTLSREGLQDTARRETGGLSGAPLRDPSTALIRRIAAQTDGRLPIIGVGGIRSAADIRQKLDAGASLVQLYTALVYEGPRLPGRLLRSLAAGAA